MTTLILLMLVLVSSSSLAISIQLVNCQLLLVPPSQPETRRLSVTRQYPHQLLTLTHLKAHVNKSSSQSWQTQLNPLAKPPKGIGS